MTDLESKSHHVLNVLMESEPEWDETQDYCTLTVTAESQDRIIYAGCARDSVIRDWYHHTGKRLSFGKPSESKQHLGE